MSHTNSILNELESIEEILNRSRNTEQFDYGVDGNREDIVRVVYSGTTIPPQIESLITRSDSHLCSTYTESEVTITIEISTNEY